jgi:hypothetical protein
MKKVITAFLLLSLSFQMKAQDLDYGDVEAIDFALEAKGLTETPDAVFILKKEHLDFFIAQNNGFTQRRTVHERIKINTEDGLKYATKKVLLYMEDGSYTEKLKQLQTLEVEV